MKARFASVVLLGFVLIAAAACGGSDGLTTAEEKELQDRLEAAEAAEAEAERLRKEAEAAEAQAEADRKAAEEAREAAEAAAEAARKEQEAAEQAQREAEEKAAAEEEARKEAEREAQEAAEQAQREAAAAAEAERLRQAEEEARQAAEAERQRLANEAEQRRRADSAERARAAIAGTLTTSSDDPGPTLAVGTIQYNVPVPLTEPDPPFTTTTSRSGRWAITGHSAVREPVRHTIEIYSDVEPDTREAFRTSRHNPSNAVIDGTGTVVGHVNIVNGDDPSTQHGRLATSGSFPREIGNPVPFTLVDRGITEAQYDALDTDGDGTLNELDTDDSGTVTDEDLAGVVVDGVTGITRAQYNQYRADRGFRDTGDFPQRYAYTTSGQLQGAGGTYRCSAGNAATDTCTVQNRGVSFEFAGNNADWDFIPSSGSVTIVVEDAHHMWFGWWAQQTVRLGDSPNQSTETWAFQAAHGGTNAVTGLADATGSATYRGPAAGRYAVYEPDTGDSSIGDFTASATLQADFDAATNTVSGTITNFSNDSSWSLALKRGDVDGGTTGNDGTTVGDLGGVTWTIDGIPDDSGAWEAGFYSDLGGGTITYQPHGIAGTFEATYDPSGAGARAAVIGGFGAHR